MPDTFSSVDPDFFGGRWPRGLSRHPCGRAGGVGPMRRAVRFLAMVLGALGALGAIGAIGQGPTFAFEAGKAVPQRVVSLSLCADQFVVPLVPRERIVAVSALAANENYSSVAAEARGLPVHGGTAEEVLALEPDLVIAGGYARRETAELLERLKVPLVRLPPGGLNEVPDLIRRVAAATGTLDAGERLEARFEAALAPQGMDNRIGALYRPGGDLPGPKTTENDVIERAGLKSLAALLGVQGYGRLHVEELVLHRPDVLIFDSADERQGSLSTQMLFHPALARAMFGTPIVNIPIRYWLCGAPRVVEAVTLLRAHLRAFDAKERVNQ